MILLFLFLAATPDFKPYTETIPNSIVSFSMAPAPAGTFTMGSDKPGENPPHKVKVDAFWIGTREVTWDEYRLFMFSNMAGEKPGQNPAVDAVSRPTKPYIEMSFGMGLNGFPAISMTQHAANKYAEWLSAKTGQFYRLPTEAEWEYACKLGAGNEGWSNATSPDRYQMVGKKKPDALGLYDMLGNVSEWTLDQYSTTYYATSPPDNPWNKQTSPYPQVARGGSWMDEPAKLTCTNRIASDPSWKMQDPQLPKSIWYLTDAQFLGFRLVRPLKEPSAQEKLRYWNNGVERE